MSTRILVIDDEPDIRLLLKDILEDEGYEIQLAEDAAAARNIKALLRPDLILLDIWMPGVDGVTLLKEWSAAGQIDCPVVMMSGHGTVETAVEATRYGAVAFIEKPLSIAKLLNTVKTALASGEERASTATASEVEQPVGNSPVMQALRQLAQNLKDGNQTIYMTGSDAGSCRIWAEYVCQASGPTEQFSGAASIESWFPLSSNLYIEEVADLGRQQQSALVDAINRPGQTGRFRVLIGSRLHWSELRQLPGLEPRLIAAWEDAVRIPSLNEHIEDIPELIDYYVNWFSEHDQLPYRHFNVAAQNLLRNFDWKGGIEQFKEFVRRMLASGDSETIEDSEIHQMLTEVGSRSADSVYNEILEVQVNLNLGLKEAREIFEREYLSRHLELSGFNIAELARRVGQERTHLYRKLKSLGLPTKK